jgi:hypothetical protein
MGKRIETKKNELKFNGIGLPISAQSYVIPANFRDYECLFFDWSGDIIAFDKK